MIAEILGIIGGAGVIILGLSAWLGKIWSSRIIDNNKSILALNNSIATRNSDARFELYIHLWNELQDLKSIGDRLWQRAGRNEIELFTKQLAITRVAINRGRIVLGETDYRLLDKVLSSFEQYRVGKRELREMRSQQDWDESYMDSSEYDIHSQIRSNETNKKKYEKLLDELAKQFKKELGFSA